VGETKYAYSILARKPEENRKLGRQGIDQSRIWKWILKTWGS
jgi:hypothetical protein